MGCWDWLG